MIVDSYMLYMLDEVLDKIKTVISIDTKILMEAEDKFPDGIALKHFVILITCIIKDGGQFYPHIFFEEPLVA